jgi:hypothetical protein
VEGKTDKGNDKGKDKKKFEDDGKVKGKKKLFSENDNLISSKVEKMKDSKGKGATGKGKVVATGKEKAIQYDEGALDDLDAAQSGVDGMNAKNANSKWSKYITSYANLYSIEVLLTDIERVRPVCKVSRWTWSDSGPRPRSS